MLALPKTTKWSLVVVVGIVLVVMLTLLDPASVGLFLGKFSGNLIYGVGESLITPIAGSLNPSTERSRRITLDVLNSHETVKLITRETESRVEFKETERYGWLTTLVGKRKGTLAANVTFVYGINVDAVKPEHVSVSDTAVVVELPELRPLYVIPDLDSMQYQSGSSLINRLIDRVHDLSLKQKIYSSLQANARRIARRKNLDPDRDEVLRDLENTLGPLIESKTGRAMRFR